MPGYLLSVSDADKAVVRPVVLQVCRALQTHLNLGRSTEMIYAGDTLAIPQKGSNLSDKNDCLKKVKSLFTMEVINSVHRKYYSM
ncbi:TPA: hypothetical protein JG809_004442 [Vibrio parahaemolyticus]|nr:hypothetical protein [Vibrio parahaemolyticus]EJA7341032.1 hypothetical protein [Vibrio parahaemolyticus]MDF4680025.1 hypothetical protein [Vibrio parahaemolyticus]MDF4922536.1 hypothetical protein [Vibrio parahaemolyticus]MEA5333359.1 hypothetical protein [Vibrio parahaemolyticus]MEA5344115.1 hypothetical protein [Vibrio parahaemolyticus]